MTEPTHDIDLRDPGVYRFWIDEHVRFADLDPLGHANNGAIGTYFESARVAWLDSLREDGGHGGPAIVLARIAIDFRRELHYPNRVRVGQRVLRIGRTSIVLGGGVFTVTEEAPVCVATSEAVCVLFDLKTRRPVEIAEDQRALLARFA